MKQRNIYTVYFVICGHDKSAPYSGWTWVLVYVGKYYVYVGKH